MGNNEVATREPQDIKSLLLSDKMRKQFAIALPKHLTPDRFVRVALTALNKTPKLAQCTQASLFGCLMDLSQIGLEPDGRKAHLIPYGNKATLIIDYKGLVELVRNTGEITDIHADVVYSNDEFEYSFGTGANLIHKPALKDRGELIAAYSFVRLKDNSSSYEVMNKEEVNAIRERSKAKNSGPWVSDFNEMAKKTVFRRHSKWLPLSSESSRIQIAIEKDYDTPIDMGKLETAGKPQVEQTLSKSELEAQNKEEAPDVIPADSILSAEERADKFKVMLADFEEAKGILGDKAFFEILIANNVSSANKITSFKLGKKILLELNNAIDVAQTPEEDKK